VLATTIGFNEGSNFGFSLIVGIIIDTTISVLIVIEIEKVHRFTPKEMRM